MDRPTYGQALDGAFPPREGFRSLKERAEFEMAHGQIMDEAARRAERNREGD